MVILASTLVTQTANVNDIINPIEGFDTIDEGSTSIKI